MEEAVLLQLENGCKKEQAGDTAEALSIFRSAIFAMETLCLFLGRAHEVDKLAVFQGELAYYRDHVSVLEQQELARLSGNTRAEVAISASQPAADDEPDWDELEELEELAPLSFAALQQVPPIQAGFASRAPAPAPHLATPSAAPAATPAATAAPTPTDSPEKKAYALLAQAQALDTRAATAHARGALSPMELQGVLAAFTDACTAFIALGAAACPSARRTVASALDRLEILRGVGYGAGAAAPEGQQEYLSVLTDLPSVPGMSDKFAGSATVAPVIASVGSSANASAPTAPSAAGTKKFTGANKKAAAAQMSSVGNLALGGGELSDAEKAVLRSSSVIGGRVFQPWLQDEEKREPFRFDHPYCDPDGILPLSASQVRAGAKFLRPSQILAAANKAGAGAGAEGGEGGEGADKPVQELSPDAGIHVAKDGNLSMRTTRLSMVGPAAPFVDAMSVTQEMVADCSFVCSLIIAALYESKQKKRLITSILFPQDSHNLPVVNPSGKYLVRLFINGASRKVVVDDRLPCLTSQKHGYSRLLCSTAVRENRLELWVSIIEKAYMKVHGGYSFLGSNSGRDLYTLTGWIPEQIYLQKRLNVRGGCISEDDAASEKEAAPVLDHRQDSERAWSRLESAHAFGDALITVCTSDLSAEQEAATGLVPTHAYAVLEVRQAGSLRMLKIKNPWAAKPWRGRFSSSDRKSWTRGLKRLLLTSGKRASAGTDAEEEAVFGRIFDQMEEKGIFYVEFTDLLNYFKGIFVNWNPALFKFRTSLHEFWPGHVGPADDRYYRGDNPQYSLIVDANDVRPGSSTPVWLLFSRHIFGGHDDGQDDIFTAVHVYAHSGGNRIYDGSQRPFIKGVYCNDVHVLVRIDVDGSLPPAPAAAAAEAEAAGSAPTGSGSEFTVVLSQDGRLDQATNVARDMTYTMSVYGAEVPYRFCSAPGPGKFKYEFTGKFVCSADAGPGEPATSGGPPGSGVYQHNPQWYLRTADSVGTRPDDKWFTVHLEAFYKKEVMGNLTIIELPPSRVSAAAGSLSSLRLSDMPPPAGADNVQWVDPQRPGKRKDGATALLKLSSGPYRRGYCHVPRVRLRATTDYMIVLSNYSASQTGGYRLNCFAGEVAKGGASALRTVAQIPHI